MSVRLPPHRHCPQCDDPIPEDREFCSEECREEQVAKKRRNSRRMLLFYIAAIIGLMALWVYTILF